MIDLRLLLQFAAVAESLSFTAAARRLGVGQPRLSAQIRKLESQLGFALLERSTRRVTLTARGAELFVIALPLAEAARDAAERTEALRRQVGAVVRIGCPQLGAPDPMQARLFADFQRHSPGMVLDVHPGLSADHARHLKDGALDLALMSVPPDGPDWDHLHLYPLALAAVLHRADPLADKEHLTPDDFRNRAVAVFARRRAPALHDRLYGALVAVGANLIEVPELRRSLLRDSPDLIVSTIVAAPADADLRHDLVRRIITGAAPLAMSLVRPRGGQPSPAAERFWRWASRTAER